MSAHLYEVEIELAGLVGDIPRDSVEQIQARRDRYISFAPAVYTVPVYGDNPLPYDVIRTGEWDAKWKVYVEAWNADSARERATLRVQEDSMYAAGMFEDARSVHITVYRTG